MNDDQLYYFLVDKNTRNVMQIEYPSDLDEFNKILGTSEGKGDLLKDLGIILKDTTKVFENPVELKISKATEAVNEATTEVINEVIKKKEKKTTKKADTAKPAKKKEAKQQVAPSNNLFAGLFD